MLNNKNILITCAGSGIGRATSLLAAGYGANVFCVDLTEGADTTAAEIQAAGGTATSLRANVAEEAEVEAFVQQCVDHYGRIDGIYAIGDVAGAPWLAHKASHEGVMVAEIIAGKHTHTVDPNSIAGCTYCHPQIASVGLTEEEANKKGLKVKIGRFPFIGNGKAIALGEQEGLIKTIFEAKTGELLGAHMVGAEVTELIQGYVLGQKLETTEEDLISTVFPHPTLSEMMHESVLDAFGRAIHI